jgi:uncharacterized protein YndB with AHSA1/START domain
MPTYSASTHIDKPAAAVYEYIAELGQHGEWSADPLEITRVDGDGGVGTRYTSTARSKGKTITAEITVVKAEPGSVFGFEVEDLTGRYEHNFTMTPTEGGTDVERRIVASGLSPAQLLLFYLVLPTVKRPNAKRALENLKAQLEAGPATST